MLDVAKRTLKEILGHETSVGWVKKVDGSWLAQHLQGAAVRPASTLFSSRIEKLADQTNRQGPQPLWEGYGANNALGTTRMPSGVRTTAVMGNVYSWLVRAWQPDVIVEFGTAFGVSGMYFLAGLETNGKGKLLTFEPNETWRRMAVACLDKIGTRFVSTAGTFEATIDDVLAAGERIDMAFIDAIHTSEFVTPQLELVVARCNDHALVLLDDISFSDDMRECWNRVSRDPRFVSSVALGQRVGILEYARR